MEDFRAMPKRESNASRTRGEFDNRVHQNQQVATMTRKAAGNRCQAISARNISGRNLSCDVDGCAQRYATSARRHSGHDNVKRT